MNIPEKIKKRMRALQAMAHDASSENEALIAARRLQALMIKYNLSSEDLHGESDYRDREGESFEIGAWARTISMAVADLYFCKIYYQSVSNKEQKIHFVGSPAHREQATMMARTIVSLVDAAARGASRDGTRPAYVDGWAFITSFRRAASLRIAARCKELVDMANRGELEDPETGETLPSCINLRTSEMMKVGEVFASMNTRTVKQKSNTSSLAGVKAGQAMADRVQLTQSVSATKQQLLS